VLEKLKTTAPGLQGLTYDPASQSALLTVIRADKNVELVPKWRGVAQAAPIPLGQNEIAEVAISLANARRDTLWSCRTDLHWGGRFPRPGDLARKTGPKPDVTNSNSDTTSVIDPEKNAVVDIISVEPFVHDVTGIAPEALTLSKGGKPGR
jgi:hypothetical protein